MTITVLVDNNTYIDQYFRGEPALCCWLEDEDRRILFDTGYSDLLLQNAAAMGIDLSTTTQVVLSHGHNDHTGGLLPFLQAYSQPVRIWAHPDAFLPKRFDGLSVGVPFDPATLPAHAELHLTREPAALVPGVLFLGEIPRKNPQEAPPVGETLRCGAWEPDRLLDDTALALTTGNGLFLLTGCSHAGICNMLQHALSLTDETRVAGVLGGLHLFEPGEQLDFVLVRLAELGASTLYPCHCTSLAVKHALCDAFDVHEVGVGLSLTL